MRYQVRLTGSTTKGYYSADALVDRLVHSAVRIDLGDVNVRRLLSEKK